MKTPLSSKAFTLIELLIVVAIIAILAAIAVPNFLEAQVRSKVSRARTDMRSAATALEAYSVDTNHYPPMLGNPPYGQPINNLDGYGNARGYGFRGLPHNLTTPVAYVTSVFTDVFKIGTVANIGASIGKPFVSGNPFDASFIYHNIRQFADVAGSGFDNGDIEDYGLWRLFSLGPDRKYNSLGTADPTLGWIYDPTNGTVSSGFIIRTQKDAIGENFSR
jgi:prepilin-type N-terminal cleavage/methylation domain-containing protein